MKPPEKGGITGDLRKKWGQDAITQGWTVIPNVLIEYQQQLSISPLELNLLLVLLKHWWRPNDPAPFPSKRLMAEITGKSESVVQRAMKRLETRGLIKREGRYLQGGGGQTTNGYDLSGLIVEVKKLAKEARQLKESQENEKAQKRRGYGK